MGSFHNLGWFNRCYPCFIIDGVEMKIGVNLSIVFVIILLVTVIGAGVGWLAYKDGEACRIQGGVIVIPNSTCEWQNSIRGGCETVKCLLNNGSSYDV